LKGVTSYELPTPISSWSVVLKSFIFFVSSVNKSNFHRYPLLAITERSAFSYVKLISGGQTHQTTLPRPKYRKQYDNVSCTIPCGYRLKPKNLVMVK